MLKGKGVEEVICHAGIIYVYVHIFHADQKKKKKREEFNLEIESNSLVTRCLNFMIDVKKYSR